MTSGVPLYLVSACGTAEEFVAAFRRYADRTGLFVPSQAPLPAGRKGRIAVTLKDGGVMIEGEAEILQSSAKPTVLYGRPGMTIKFVEPDEPSKIIIGELEKARLAMKVPAPSVPPRPANVPAEPRAVVPPPGGRIDATNALAECVVIGDPSTLKETAAPRAPGGAESGKAKFVVPSIPTAPRSKTPSMSGGDPSAARPKTPSSMPELNAPRPKTPSSMPELTAPRPKTPSMPGEVTAINAAPPGPILREPSKPTPNPIAKETSKPTPNPIAKETSKPTPNPIAKETSKPTPNPNLKMTSIGFPAIDKAPAPPATNPLLDTLQGTDAPPNPTKQISAENPLLQTQHGVFVGKPGMQPAAPSSAAPVVTPIIPVDDEATTIGESPPKKNTDPMPTTAPTKSAELDAVPQGLLPEPPRLDAKSKATHKATSIGFPALRTPFETQPVGVVPPPTNPPRDADPSAPVVAKSKPAAPGPRAKNPTTPPLTPRHPTPAAPLPIVRMPMRNAPVEEEEKTDLSAVPPAPKNPSGPTELPEEKPMPQIDPFGKTDIGAMTTGRSGGMRASEIMAAIPTEDWTMTPDASGPTVLPKVDGEGDGEADAGDVKIETKTTPKGPPTGNWTISLDPEAGWSEPQKLPAPAPEKPPEKPPAPERPKGGNPDMAVASKMALEAVEWEEKPTGIGEAKIEIDPTLMEPLKPMPALDDDDPLAAPPLPTRTTGPVQQRAEVIPPPLAPMPPIGPTSIPASAIMSPSTGTHTAPPMAVTGFPAYQTNQGFPAPPPGMHELGASGSVAALAEPAPSGSRKRMFIIVGAAAFAVIAGFLLVLMLAGGKSKKSAAGGKGSAGLVDKGSADRVVVVPDAAVAVPDQGSDQGSAAIEVGSGAGSQQVAGTNPDQGSNATPPPGGGTCKVEVTSVPTGADVFLDKNKLGTTPGTFDLPCGASASLILKKPKFLATERAFTPSADKPNKLVIKLGKTMFSLKVTSTPSGATITIGGKSAGVTPATVKVPGLEASAITLTKPGFAKDTQRVTAKANGQSHHVVLKKGR